MRGKDSQPSPLPLGDLLSCPLESAVGWHGLLRCRRLLQRLRPKVGIVVCDRLLLHSQLTTPPVTLAVSEDAPCLCVCSQIIDAQKELKKIDKIGAGAYGQVRGV